MNKEKPSVIVKILNHPILLALGLLATLISLWQFIYEPFQERELFDESIEKAFRENRSGFMSSTNYMLDVIPRNAYPTREKDHWNSFSYSWKKHSGRLEQIYEPISTGLIEGSMRAGSSSEQVCSNVEAVVKSHYEILAKVSQIPSISVSYTGETAPELAMFGSVVVVPQIPYMEIMLDKACDISLENIRIEIAKSKELSQEDKIEAVRKEIERIETMKSFDFKTALRNEMKKFVTTYSGHLSSQGMHRGDAESEALLELKKTMARPSGTSNWMVPGMNTITDNIFRLIEATKEASKLDYDAEIERLRKIERQLDTKFE